VAWWKKETRLGRVLFCGRLMAVLGGGLAYLGGWVLRGQFTALDWLVPGILGGAALGIALGLVMVPKE
jgi:hypothetical protein